MQVLFFPFLADPAPSYDVSMSRPGPISLRIPDLKKMLCCKDWKSMTKREQLKQLDLGGLVGIVIHRSGPFNAGCHRDSNIATNPTKYTIGVTAKPGWTVGLIDYGETRAFPDIEDVEDGVKDGGERGFMDSATIQGDGMVVDEYWFWWS